MNSNELYAVIQTCICGIRDALIGPYKVYSYKFGEHLQPARSERQRRPSRSRRQRGDPQTTSPDSKNVHKIFKRIAYCCLWNGGLCLSSYLLFHFILLPALHLLTEILIGSFLPKFHATFWTILETILHWTFSTLWLLPIFVLGKIVNSLWFQDIANASYIHGRRNQRLFQIGLLLADTIFSSCVQAVFLIQTYVVSHVPFQFVAQLLTGIHLSVLYSLYAFEYRWFCEGIELTTRLKYVEVCWPYFIGFGLPLALLSSVFDSALANSFLFSLLFPFLIIGANEADIQRPPSAIPRVRLFLLAGHISDAIFKYTMTRTARKGSQTIGTETEPGI